LAGDGFQLPPDEDAVRLDVAPWKPQQFAEPEPAKSQHGDCWNYLYLSQKLAEIEDPLKREEFLKAVAHGSAAAWEHVNLLGEYDLSEEKFKDSVGIKPPKLID
jgi:hypothetical protein